MTAYFVLWIYLVTAGAGLLFYPQSAGYYLTLDECKAAVAELRKQNNSAPGEPHITGRCLPTFDQTHIRDKIAGIYDEKIESRIARLVEKRIEDLQRRATEEAKKRSKVRGEDQ